MVNGPCRRSGGGVRFVRDLAGEAVYSACVDVVPSLIDFILESVLGVDGRIVKKNTIVAVCDTQG